jgi:DNA-binding transcriptional MocR family regulator
MVMPNFQNPLGFQMRDERKRAMVEMLARHDVPVIENDVYHELYYGDGIRPRSRTTTRAGWSCTAIHSPRR